MQGNINMGGFKIVNLGQNNLQGRDAVNYDTLTSTATDVEIASDGIFSAVAIFPNVTIRPKPPAFTSLPNPYVLTLAPGSMLEFGIADTNWAAVLQPNIPSYVLTSNNIPGSYSSVKLRAEFTLQYTSALASIPVYLLVFNYDNGALVASRTINVPPGFTGVSGITVDLQAVPGPTFSKLCCALVANVVTPTSDIVIEQTQLSKFCYLFTN